MTTLTFRDVSKFPGIHVNYVNTATASYFNGFICDFRVGLVLKVGPNLSTLYPWYFLNKK